jgi:hypothetical protein
MKLIFTLITSFLSLGFIAQSNLTVFNNGGQQFFVILNGIKQNSVPQTNVVVSGIKNGGYAMKVIFADGKTPDLNRRLFFEEPQDVSFEAVFKKGKGNLRLISIVPVSGSMNNGLVYRENDGFIYSDAPVVNQQHNNWNAKPNSNQQTDWNNQQNVNQQTNWNTNTQISTPQNTDNNWNNQQTQTTFQTNTTGQPMNGSVQVNTNLNTNQTNTQWNDNNLNGGVNLNVNVNGTGMNTTFVDPVTGETFNMNMNMNVDGLNTQQTTTQTTTVTTNTSGNWNQQNNQTQQNTNWNNNQQNNQNQQNTNWSNTQQNTQNNNWNNQTQPITAPPVTNSKFINCTNAIWNFDEFMSDLKEQSFESSKIDIMKKDLVQTCVSFQQAKQMLELLTFEASRYEMAQYLYFRMTDRPAAERGMLPLFTFEATKNDWRDFVRNNR